MIIQKGNIIAVKMHRGELSPISQIDYILKINHDGKQLNVVSAWNKRPMLDPVSIPIYSTNVSISFYLKNSCSVYTNVQSFLMETPFFEFQSLEPGLLEKFMERIIHEVNYAKN